MARCPTCDGPISEGASFCENCGTEINVNDRTENEPESVTTRAEQILETSDEATSPETAEEKTTVETNVLAGNVNVVGRRIGAKMLDWIVVLVIYIVLVLIFGASLSGGRATGPSPGRFFLFFGFPIILNILYHTVLEAEWSQTVGKRLLGIVVLKEDGRDITYGDSIIRNLIRYIDAIFYYLVGIIVIALSSKKQRLGDILANTVVVKKES